MKMQSLRISLVALAALAGTASASPLSLGGSNSTAQLTVSPPPGVQIASMTTAIAAVGGIVNGTVDSWVFDHGAGLTFAYRVNIVAPSSAVGRVTVSGPWDSVVISDTGYQALSGVIPDSLDYLQSNTLGANFVGSNGLAQGTNSAIYWFQTNASSYRPGDVFVIDGVVGLSAGFVPIPLPSAGLMGLAGVGLLAVRRRHR